MILLFGVCGVNDHSIFGLVIDDEVSVVVTTPRPFVILALVHSKIANVIVDLHIGIDWICMARVNASYDTVSRVSAPRDNQ